MNDTPDQPQRDPAQVLEQAKNARALYHHIEWTLKLLGHNPADLPTGDYTLMLHVLRHDDGNVSVPHYDLVRNVPDDATEGEPK